MRYTEAIDLVNKLFYPFKKGQRRSVIVAFEKTYVSVYTVQKAIEKVCKKNNDLHIEYKHNCTMPGDSYWEVI